ncbi:MULTISPECIES: hypothetical protein [Pseudomonas]|uniref:hypothetical protein n=1 Tax=Pseudomonas TaxID=286 RepID=UPI0005A9F362|nr:MULTISPECIES: hypothetical protein [Pseudomonas]AZD93052.1 hypothetical protein C4K13_3635 [Pseudomonas chlororaphis subsp. aureofaciens]KAB0532784.1 hypothetical protein F7R16_11105 [Pseudomonas chlororaphis subsp. aureofaciens]TSD26028.1 hypothetical protein FCE86_031685 [Pseudomonas sp. ATCC 13985]WDG57854.1 hypothetical protein PUP52_18580 [Pseudomonas chlororaphis]WDG64067.1 hypothetical protein PUP59_18585 [Pseudomonas chlororaphis]
MNKFFVALGFAVSLTACGQADKENAARLQQEVSKLQGEISTLRAELEAERNGPDRLLARAKNEVSQPALDSAKQTLTDLIARYPESQQALSAKSVLSDVNTKIKAAEKAKQLEAARAAEEQKQVITRLDANLRKNTDEIEGVTWISHKSEPVLDNYMSLYFGTKDGSASQYPLRMKFNYYADSWLFVKSVTIKADDQVFNLGNMDFERDNGAGSIWEWSDSRVKDMAMLNKIIAAKKVVIRYDGRQYYHDFVLPESQKNAMKEIVLAWQRYGGKA